MITNGLNALDFRDDLAEQSLLGAALTDPRITGLVKLRGADFGQTFFGTVWDGIRAAHDAGETPDPSTVGKRVPASARRQVGPLLVECVSLGIPANAEHYAGIILDRAQRRRMHIAMTSLQQRLFDIDTPVEDLVAIAERELIGTSGLERAVEKALTLDEFVDQPLPDHEWVIPDMLARGERLVLTGTEGGGKALATDTPIPTPTGWTTMGDVRIGDLVIGADGRPTRVVAATDVMHDRPCYRITFSDGQSIVADAEHQWLTSTLRAREVARRERRRELKPRGTDQRHKRLHFPAVVTTTQIRDTLMARDGFCANHSIPTSRLDLDPLPLPIEPYTLGAWLGDGTSRGASITCDDRDRHIVDRIAATYPVMKAKSPLLWRLTDGVRRGRGHTSATVQGLLREQGLLGKKHIPPTYLRASHEQRLALIQGLMDTDGTIGEAGKCEFSVVSPVLAADFLALTVTLGIKATMRESPAVLDGVRVGTRYRICFFTDLPVFSLPRKAERIKTRTTDRSKLRYITAVDPMESVPVRCIRVEAPDHLFLAGEGMIPTHNSMLLRQVAVAVAAGLDPFSLRTAEPRKVLYVDCENPVGIMARKFADIRRVIRTRGKDVGTRMFIQRYPQGMDLAQPRDRLELHHLCQTFTPDLLVIGPAYKLYVGGAGAREEDLARQVTSVLDGLREEFGFALLLEHHSPHASPGIEQRTVRPIGSSLWLRWPEFGYGLRPYEDPELRKIRKARGIPLDPEDRAVDFVPWRGAREERPWPDRLNAGGEGALPWVDLKRIRP